MNVNNKKVAIWGVGSVGQSCFDQLQNEDINVVFFMDKNPPASGYLNAIPAHSSEDLLKNNFAEVPEVDIIFLAFLSSKYIPVRQLRAAGFLNQTIAFIEGSKISQLLKINIGVNSDSFVPDSGNMNGSLHIYPIEIPEIKVNNDLDLLLLELPPRQIPMMPYGVGYVHNILKTTGISFQTLDLNMIMYHRYYSRLYLNGEEPPEWANGSEPWDGKNFSQWSDNKSLKYFDNDIQEIVDAIIQSKPKILGISIHIPNLTLAQKIIVEVKKCLPETIIIIGGYACVYREMALFDIKIYDYIVMREAELTLPPLIKTLMKGEMGKDIPGIISRYDSPERKWQEGPIPNDLDAIPFPTYEWADLKLYRMESGGTATPIAIGRGCKWAKCNFCGERFKFRKRNPYRVVDEIEWHVKQGFTNFISMESDINGDPDHLLSVCREIIRRKLKVSLFGQLRIDPRNTLEFFTILKQAGFSGLVYGVDGWCDHVLFLQRKGYRMKTVFENLHNCHRAGIVANVNMIVGVPGETEDDINDSIKNIVAQKENINSVTTINMVRLVHGSHYYNKPEKFNIRFVGEKEEVYSRDPHIIDERLWYSADPYIDYKIRSERYKKICRELYAAGVNIGEWAKWENTNELKRMDCKKIQNFDEAIS